MTWLREALSDYAAPIGLVVLFVAMDVALVMCLPYFAETPRVDVGACTEACAPRRVQRMSVTECTCAEPCR